MKQSNILVPAPAPSKCEVSMEKLISSVLSPTTDLKFTF